MSTAALLRPALDQKRTSTLVARAALAGIVVLQTDTGTGAVEFVASRRNLTKRLPSLDALETWLNAVTGSTTITEGAND